MTGTLESYQWTGLTRDVDDGRIYAERASILVRRDSLRDRRISRALTHEHTVVRMYAFVGLLYIL